MTVLSRKLALACGVGAVALTLATGAFAQQRNFNIPAQDAAGAIAQFGLQAGVQITAPTDALKGVRTPALKGAMDARAALQDLLKGTGLVVARDDGRTIVLQMRPQSNEAAPVDSRVEEVVVTGTRLAGMSAPSRVYDFSGEDVKKSGEANLAAFLNRLPQVSIGASGGASQRAGGEMVVQLRGLPEGSTQVLLDGRSLGVSGINVRAAFDLNSMPPGIIERLDVLPTGSSAIYGSDAIGGVINIITRKTYQGLDVSAGYDFAKNYESKSGRILAGRQFDRGGIVGMISYQTNDAVRGSDRALTRDSNFTRFVGKGGIDWRGAYCAPGNVTAVSGTLNGVGTASAAIPASGANAAANYVAGSSNRCAYTNALALVVPASRFGAFVSGHFDLTPRAELYGDMLYSFADVQPSSGRRSLANQLVPASNAFNPFGQAVTVSTSIPTRSGYGERSRLFRPLVGLRYDLGRFKLDGVVWDTLIQQRATYYGMAISAAGTAMLASSDKASAVNLFDVGSNSQAMLNAMFSSPTGRARTESKAANLTATGDLFDLPAGPVKLAIGGEVHHDTYLNQDPSNLAVTSRASRDIDSAFAELGVPLLRGRGADPLLQADLAVRRDRYSDVGSSTSPQVALAFRPREGLIVRASYSQSFKAPGLGYLHLARVTYPNTVVALTDPKRNETLTYPITEYGGGNPNLKPETGEARSISLEWAPPQGRFHAGLAYWRIGMDNRISTNLSGQSVLDNEDVFAGRVMREASVGGVPGRIVSIDFSMMNYGSLRLDGLDLDASYRFDTPVGAVTVGTAITRTLDYKAQILPSAPYQDRLSKAVSGDSWAPAWKGAVYADWKAGWGDLGVAVRYTGQYLDYQTRVNTNEIGDIAYVDLNLSLPLGETLKLSGLASGLYARIVVDNVLDRQPQYSNFSAYGYDPTQADMLGRRMAITLGARF